MMNLHIKMSGEVRAGGKERGRQGGGGEEEPGWSNLGLNVI